MTPVQKLAGLVLLILVLMASAAGVTWQVQGWRMGKKLAEQAGLHKDDMAAISNAAAAQARTQQDKRLATEQQLAAQDQQHTKELSDAQRNQAVLRDRLAIADVRLSVLLDATDSASSFNVPPAPGTVGVVHAARRAQLDPAHAQRIIAITDEGDRGLIALRACQAYVRTIAPDYSPSATAPLDLEGTLILGR
ncbi:lysis system i-spanin subunit Rz [Pseudomonas sp. Irchel 3H9]|uniref:lysis system i-spanin subunit Rz n=1 Tax=Pseudomonas sp. Irchel 3H9 TaxID=2009043 RepID=UPI000BA309F8|nr:lysis system i-spanin subunit Rz [Pseudomonas sp. Irchel 3H9]